MARKKTMQAASDLDSILTDGFSLKYDWAGVGPQNVTISLHQIGELVLTSGIVVPCDPFIVPDVRYHLVKTLNPGRYPIIVSLADFQPSGDKRFACAMLKISDAQAVRWEVAFLNDPNPNKANERTDFGVDAGTGCFVDADAAKIISDLVSLDVKYPEKDDFEMFCETATAEMIKNSFGKYPLTAGWADLEVSNDTDANIIMFSSGWGDGGYSSFWGYDTDNNLSALVTDFGLFG